MYLILFALNLVIESFVAFLFGRRDKLDYYVVLGINGITHPGLMIYLLIANDFDIASNGVLIILELVIVLIEWMLMRYMYHSKDKKLLLQALAMNAVSFAAGLILFNL